MGAFFAIVLSLLAIFLVLLVLVQRGRGGGLAGALGGMGGSSAFGAKAGDVFTRITIITAAIWIAICLMALFWAKHGSDALDRAGASTETESALDMLPQAPRDQAGSEPATSAADVPPSPPAGSKAPAEGTATPPADNQ
jgi:preprotein translocase subunit SecG